MTTQAQDQVLSQAAAPIVNATNGDSDLKSMVMQGTINMASQMRTFMTGVYYLPVPIYLNNSWVQLDWQDFRVPIPNVFMFAAGYSSLMHLRRQLMGVWRHSKMWFYSWFNATKYLQSQSDLNEEAASDLQAQQPNAGPPMRENVKTSFAVIYGCSNKVGKAFALYLADKGFNLILVERDAESIQNIKDEIQQKLTRNPIIHTVVLEHFDQKHIHYQMSQFATEHVKIFVNSKSVQAAQDGGLDKLKKINKSLLEKRQKELKALLVLSPDADALLQEQQDIEKELDMAFEVCSKTEVKQAIAENIQGYVTLVNVFMRAMCLTSKHPCIINVEDSDHSLNKMLDDVATSHNVNILYQSTISFNEQFTRQIARRFQQLNTINVRINTRSFRDEQTVQLQSRLCEQTFAYIGLKDTISV